MIAFCSREDEMSREQNELQREIEEGLAEVVNQQEEWEKEEIDDDWDKEDNEDDDWDYDEWDYDESDDWDEDEEDEEDDWEEVEDTILLREGEGGPLFFGGCLYPAEDVQRAQELLWGGEFGIEA